MCDRIEAIESRLEEAINTINEINNDQIDSYHYMLTTLEDVSEELKGIKENYVAIEAIKPILDAIKDLTNEVSELKREMKSPKTTVVNNSSASTKTTWKDIIEATYGKNHYVDVAGTHYTIKKMPDPLASLKFIF